MIETSTGPSAEQKGTSFGQWVRAWRYLFGLIGAIVVVVGFYAEENWRGEWAWRRVEADAQRRNEPIDPARFIPSKIPDRDNFAMTPALAPLFGFIPGTTQRRPGIAPNPALPRFESAERIVGDLKPKKAGSEIRSNSWVLAQTDLNSWLAAFLTPTNAHGQSEEKPITTNLPVAEAAGQVLGFLSEYEPLFDELREASHRPRSRFPIHYEQEDPASILIPHLAPLKNMCAALRLRASAELASGKAEEALKDIELMFVICNSTRDEPILISQLVRTAQFKLALQPIWEGMDQWSDSQLRELQEWLAGFDFCADLRRALQAERAFFGVGLIEYVRNSSDRNGVVSNLGRMDNNGSYALVGLMISAAPNGWFYFEEANHSRIFEEYLLNTIELTNRVIRPAVTRRATEESISLQSHSAPILFFRHKFFSALLLPWVGSLAPKAAFGQSAADNALVACALQRYRLAHGEFPSTLEALKPFFGSDAGVDRLGSQTNAWTRGGPARREGLPHDIINGEPLKYRRTDKNHYVLYSIGWNEKDDGGKAGVYSTPADRPIFKENEKAQEGDWVWCPR
ncbi:MAG TPA: hypothetical protein VLT36_21535 [Candidatus Dormibacteraeota bacterium]|nr:hypothetical protein [Candidatus Dormibacteraeota bacterium]